MDNLIKRYRKAYPAEKIIAFKEDGKFDAIVFCSNCNDVFRSHDKEMRVALDYIAELEERLDAAIKEIKKGH